MWHRRADPPRGRRRFRLSQWPQKRADCQLRRTAAPSRASACLRSSSTTSDRPSAMRAAAAASARLAGVREGRRSGAWRSATRSTARQPRKAVDALADDAGEVLDFDCRGPRPEHENTGGRSHPAIDPRTEPVPDPRAGRVRSARGHWTYRLAVSGNLSADDLRPARDQFGRSKALARECSPTTLPRRSRNGLAE